MPCTRHRVFLAALIVAAKFLNDSSPKNKHWATYARIFDREEVNLMEKQLVFLLDFDFQFTEQEAIQHFKPFMRGGDFHKMAPFRTKEEIRKRVGALARNPIAVPTAPITPPAERSLPLAVQQQRRPNQTSVSLSPPQATMTTSGSLSKSVEAPSRPPRPVGSLYPLSSADSLSTISDLTDDNGTSSSSASSSGSGSEAESTRRPRFILRPVPLERRRKASNAAAPAIRITTSTSVDGIQEIKPLRVVPRAQRAPPVQSKLDEPSITSVLSVPSFLERVFGKHSGTIEREEPRIHVPAGNALPGAERYREPVSHETIYDPELL